MTLVKDAHGGTHTPESDLRIPDLAPEGGDERELSLGTPSAAPPGHANGRNERQPGEQTRRGDSLPPGLHLVMQPIMAATALAESSDFEVLLRLRTPDGSVQGADKLIPIAERSGDLAIVDTWVMTSVLEWFRKHRAALMNTRFVCANLSASSINDARFLDETLSFLMRFLDVVPYLCLQISESVALDNLASTQHFISRCTTWAAR